MTNSSSRGVLYRTAFCQFCQLVGTSNLAVGKMMALKLVRSCSRMKNDQITTKNKDSFDNAIKVIVSTLRTEKNRTRNFYFCFLLLISVINTIDMSSLDVSDRLESAHNWEFFQVFLPHRKSFMAKRLKSLNLASFLHFLLQNSETHKYYAEHICASCPSSVLKIAIGN